MLSSIILSFVTFLQQLKFQYLYSALIIYALIIWLAYGIWLWKDIARRFSNPFLASITWLVAFITFIPGLFIYLLIRPVPNNEDEYWTRLEHIYLAHETRGMEKCEVCGYMLQPEYLFCPSCGDILREKCRVCSNVIDISWRICPFCGDEKWEEEEEAETQRNPFLSGISSMLALGYSWVFKSLIKLYYVLRANLFAFERKLFSKRASIVSNIATSQKQEKAPEKHSGKSSVLESLKKLFIVEEKVPTKKDM